MMIRCPACGAEASLDAVVEHEAAARALEAALKFAPGGTLIVRYLALFRPVKRRLTWPRVDALLRELLPAITSERVERDGRVHEVPQRAWWVALDKCIAARDAGTLRTPLKSHGYLFEIAIAEGGRGVEGVIKVEANYGATNGEGISTAVVRHSATAAAVVALEQRKRRNDGQ